MFTPTTGWRGHPEWWGWRPSDAFFPALLFVAGAGLALQTRRGHPWARLVRRFVALVVLGLVYSALVGDGLDLSRLRYPGVLQRIALVGLAGAAVVWIVGRRWRAVLAASIVATLAWGVVLHTAARDCPEDRPAKAPACATFLWLDVAVFGESHVYHGATQGHDPEGLASSAGALASFLAGFAAAVAVDARRGASAGRRGATLAAMALVWLVLTPAAAWLAPFGKRLWAPSFVTVNAAAASAVWAALVVVFDLSRLPSGSAACVAPWRGRSRRWDATRSCCG